MAQIKNRRKEKEEKDNKIGQSQTFHKVTLNYTESVV
jgi:hypothetical protein